MLTRAVTTCIMALMLCQQTQNAAAYDESADPRVGYRMIDCPMETDCICARTERTTREYVVACNGMDFDYGHDSFPDLTLDDWPVYFIYFFDNTLSSFPDGYFDNLDYLYVVNISHCQLDHYPDFPQNSTVSFVDMRANYIYFEKDEQVVPSSLKVVDFTSNQITHIYDETFSQLEELQVLMLSNNVISMITSQAFIANKNLENLYLSNNKLVYLDSRLFVNLKNLTILDLSFNKLAFLNAHIFEKLYQLRSLDLTRNSLRSLDENQFHNLQSLSLLKLTSNLLTTLPANLLSRTNKLRYIQLAANPLKELHNDIFKSLDQMLQLDVSYTSINKFPNITTMPQLHYFIAISTRIEAIYPCDIEGLNDLLGIFLAGCRLKCDCQMRWFSQWTEDVMMPTLRKIGKSFFFGLLKDATLCYSPRNLQGHDLMRIEFDEFVCEDGEEATFCHHAAPPSVAANDTSFNEDSPTTTAAMDAAQYEEYIQALENNTIITTLQIQVLSYEHQALTLAWQVPPSLHPKHILITYRISTGSEEGNQHRVYVSPDRSQVILRNFPATVPQLCLHLLDEHDVIVEQACVSLSGAGDEGAGGVGAVGVVVVALSVVVLVLGAVFLFVLHRQGRLTCGRTSGGVARLQEER